MRSPAVTAVRTKGIACTFQPAAEGYRAWRPASAAQTLSGKKLGDGAYEFINWFLDGWAGAYLNRQGYYSAVPDTAKAKMEPYERAYWMEGAGRQWDIKSPNGDLLAKAGSVRDGGSYEQRMGDRLLERGHGRERVLVRKGTSSSPPDALRSRHECRRRLPFRRPGIHPWWQALPFAAVFVLAFFLVPLAPIVMVSFWDFNRSTSCSRLHLAQLSRHVEGCSRLTEQGGLCVTLPPVDASSSRC